jgi:hypothetical protein
MKDNGFFDWIGVSFKISQKCKDEKEKQIVMQGDKMVKLSLQQAVEAHRVRRRRGSHTLWKIDPQMAVMLLA